MDTQTLVVIGVVALVVIVLFVLIRAAGSRRRTPRLQPLAAETRERYISDWDDVEAKFVDSPEQAVREAEALVTSMLRERGHPLTERDLPNEMRRARKLSYSSRNKTEAMRQAMLHYRAVMERMMGSTGDVLLKTARREVAS
jgi:flagellar biosynthesis/type III secretory pathway M-ring protein FliF/YscJ